VYLAVSGHRRLPGSGEAWIDAELRRTIKCKASGDLFGISCLADGADALFARAVLDLGGRLIAVIPATRYRDGLPASYHLIYNALLSKASETVALDREVSDADAHMDASLRMLERADELIAVWDGEPARVRWNRRRRPSCPRPQPASDGRLAGGRHARLSARLSAEASRTSDIDEINIRRPESRTRPEIWSPTSANGGCFAEQVTAKNRRSGPVGHTC
jgi:hypothetical protein